MVLALAISSQAGCWYVLFRYRFKNKGKSTVTFWAGTFMDWDIGGNASDDVGDTDLGGRLVFANSETGGPYLGTVLLGDFQPSGSFFFFRMMDQGSPWTSNFTQ